MNEICGKCQYHKYNNGEFCCTNPESEYYSDYTEYVDSCDEFEDKE